MLVQLLFYASLKALYKIINRWCFKMPEKQLIKDRIYCKCWDNIKSKVRTNIYVPKDELQTERQWAKQGYVIDRPTPEHARGHQLWTNGFCNTKCLYYFKAEVRKGSEDELRAFFAPEKEKRKALAKKAREKEIKEKKRRNICKAIIEQVKPRNSKTAKVIVIDTETTGLDCTNSELLQVSIISDKREILYNSYLRPLYTTKWIEAEKVNGISPEMVKDSPTVLTECVEINNILHQADVIIGYNTEFDLDFLLNIGCKIKDTAIIVDVMKIFAEIYGEWSECFDDYKWQKLTTCASYYGYEWQGNIHDSLADCLATLYCYEQIMNSKGVD